MALKRLGFVFGLLIFSTLAQAQSSSTPVGISILESTQNPGAPSNWGTSFFSIGSLSQKQVETGSSSYGLNAYLGLNYKISKSKRFSIRPVFNINSAGLDRSGRQIESGSSLGDAHLVYSDYEIAAMGPVEVSTSFKLYLPTSDFSQASGMIAKFRPETFISYDFNPISSVTWVIKPDFFIQSQTTFEDRKSPIRKDGTYNRKNTQLGLLEHYLEFAFEVNKYFVVKPAAGFKEDWSNDGGAPFLAATHNTNAKMSLGVDIRPMRNLTFTVIAENMVRVSDRRDDINYFRPEDNSLILMTNASL